jgi:hypothetical protein
MTYEEDLNELDRIWPLGKQLIVPDGGSVLVAGAYEGRYMDYVATRFKPGLVIGFEPQKEKANKSRDRLERHGDKTITAHVGLGVHDCMVSMDGFGTDGCHVCNYEQGHAVRFSSLDYVFRIASWTAIDLFICNMEGYEIPLLSYLCANGDIGRIKSIAVQFHSNSRKVYNLLSEHYGKPSYDDFPTWAYWKH